MSLRLSSGGSRTDSPTWAKAAKCKIAAGLPTQPAPPLTRILKDRAPDATLILHPSIGTRGLRGKNTGKIAKLRRSDGEIVVRDSIHMAYSAWLVVEN
jgi:hypothetical protein